jgi:hypothetical protein
MALGKSMLRTTVTDNDNALTEFVDFSRDYTLLEFKAVPAFTKPTATRLQRARFRRVVNQRKEKAPNEEERQKARVAMLMLEDLAESLLPYLARVGKFTFPTLEGFESRQSDYIE